MCSVNRWGGGVQTPTDFSISSLMRPTAPHPHVDPRPDGVLLSSTVRWYNLKLGDYPLNTLHDYYASGEYRARSLTSHLPINTLHEGEPIKYHLTLDKLTNVDD